MKKCFVIGLIILCFAVLMTVATCADSSYDFDSIITDHSGWTNTSDLNLTDLTTGTAINTIVIDCDLKTSESQDPVVIEAIRLYCDGEYIEKLVPWYADNSMTFTEFECASCGHIWGVQYKVRTSSSVEIKTSVTYKGLGLL